MSAVYFIQGVGRGTAVFRASEDAEDTFLCSLALEAANDPEISARFAELVNVMAAYYRRRLPVVVASPASRIEGWPCAKCESVEGADLRFRAGQTSDPLPTSPTGLLIGCCRIKAVGAYGGRSDAAPAPRRW
jgi:hypothetical protein